MTGVQTCALPIYAAGVAGAAVVLSAIARVEVALDGAVKVIFSHSFTLLCPEQAPFLVVPENAVPSLQLAVTAAGTSANALKLIDIDTSKANNNPNFNFNFLR